MQNMQTLREHRATLSKEANNILALAGDKVWTKEDKEKFDKNADQIELLDSQISALQSQLDKAAEKDFKDADQFRTKNEKPKKSAAAQGVEIFLRKQTKNYTPEDALAIQNTMSTTTGSEGGFTVQTEVASQLIDIVKGYGSMRSVADQISTSQGNDLSYPRSDGTSEIGEWVGQNVAASLQDPTFGTVPLNVFKAGSKIFTVPIELLQDSEIDITAFVMKRAGARIGRLANAGYTVGTGTGQPFGMANTAAVGKTGTTGQTTTVLYDDLVDLYDSIDYEYIAAFQESLGFMLGQQMRRVVRKIKDTNGRPIWTPSYDGGMSVKTPDLLLGQRVVINNDMPAPGANNKSIAFGNFKAYMVRDAMQVTLFKFEDSPYVSKGQIGFLAWARTGGNLLDTTGVKVYQHSAT